MLPKFRLIILGAGFSKPAGFPIADELWKEIRSTALAYRPNERAYKFKKDLDEYIEFYNNADGKAISPDDVNFEKLMRFLDVEHYLGLRGGDTWSSDGNEGTIVTKYLIGKILARHVNSLVSIPDLYLEFARRLQPHDVILTFNYDTLLERALDAVGKPYRLFPKRFDRVSEYAGFGGDDRDEVVVLKMHGSIDWFDRTSFERRVDERKRQKVSPPTDVIFSDEKALNLERVVDGPRFENDPLKNVYRAKNLKALYDKKILFHATPRILAPSATKLLYANGLNNFWEGMRDAGYLNFGMAIIGFSLPDHDEYAKQILYRLVQNYQKNYWNSDEFEQKKSPLAIVDFFRDAASEAKFMERYRFVDWSRAYLSGDGFDAASLDRVFA
ncbi:SIR2 family protein [Nisaea acidiphila]|uniref:SIR2 family protein n=1 Tax=Nisaea acidiphila TaxID=1862145 RepID=A0A9J7AQT9_9PROT|nr:SIR2 family protein [Nisaea acidiphila]UUX49542.1 SIR2 family protein [Nisaea acidiphila]